MIEFLRGTLVTRNPAYVVLECSNVGYRVNISMYTFSRLGEGNEVKLYIHEQIREDSHTLFGFSDTSERQLFQLLVSVSGVGAVIAQLLLSSLNPDEIRTAILGERDEVFSKVKGIGPKTAKRLIVELKDKVAKEGGSSELQTNALAAALHNTEQEDALQALAVLGFPRAQAQKALQQALAADPTIGQSIDKLVRAGLRNLSA